MKEPSPSSEIGALAFGLLFAGLFIFLSNWLLPGDWQLLGVICAAFIAIGTVIQFSQAQRHRQAENRFLSLFPGYTGERLPICALLRYEAPEGTIEFDPNGGEFCLGVTPTHLFVIRHPSGSDPKEAAGRLVAGPDASPLIFRRDDIAHVQVHLFTDAQIQRAAQQPGEWLANLVTLGLLGASMRTIPYAALIHIYVVRVEDVAICHIGIPTEVTGDALAILRAAVAGAAFDQAQDLAEAEIAEEFGEIVGQDAADAIAGAAFLSVGALGGSTNGRKGRLMAALIATRLRQLASCAVEVAEVGPS